MRFPEFRGEWEETTLGKISEVTKGSGISKDQLSEQGSPCILYGELYTKYKSEIIGEVYSRTELDSSSLVKSKANDVIIPCSGETAIDISTARCVPFNNILLGGDLNIIRLKNDDGGFFAYQLNGVRKTDIARVAQGVSVVHLYGENLKQIRVYHPNTEEQKKITRLLSLIDERIATQNKVIEDLKLLKSAIIEEIDNCRYSKKVRLGDIGLFVRGLTYSSNDIVENNGILVMRSNNIINGSPLDYNNNIVHVNKHISSDQHLQCGDVVICMANGSSTLVGKSSYYDGGCSLPITIGAFCGIYRSNEPLAKWLFQTSTYRRYIWNSLQGGNGAIANLNSDDILSMSFTIPDASTKDRFAKLLTYTDSAINSNTKLHSLYILQKHCLLRQMFI